MANTSLQLTATEQALGVSLPHRRMEEWRWTDLHSRLTKAYAAVKSVPKAAYVDRLLAASPFAKIAKHRVVFVNGKLDAGRSSLTVLDYSASVAASQKLVDPVLALNAALKPEGVTLRFADQTSELVEVVHVAIGAVQAMAIRNRIEVADGASASIIESFIGEGDYLVNAVTEIAIGKDGKLDRLKVEREAAEASHLSHVIYDLAENARLNDITLTNGAALNRQNGNCNFNGPHAEAKISGAYLLKAKQHADTRLVINHAVPHCTSRELFKIVLDENARGIFQGKVVVARDAQKTDGKQSSHALLLSETAEFDAKPELEIYADDVVCGHGATAGDINHDHLFYLESRGIPKAEAKSLLIAAFVGEVFDLVADEEAQAALVDIAAQWLVKA